MADDLVLVEWVDSANLFGDRWASREDLDQHEKQTVCRTAGWAVHENTHSLYVASSVSPDEIGSVMQIPLAAILKRQGLK